jgi:hypothetical protein
MPRISRDELEPYAHLVNTDANGEATYNAEHVVRIRRHAIRMLRARLEDGHAELGRHIWDGARIVALAWGYCPSDATMVVAFKECLALCSKGGPPHYRFGPENRFQGVPGWCARSLLKGRYTDEQ